jgi:hypothetical protein
MEKGDFFARLELFVNRNLTISEIDLLNIPLKSSDGYGRGIEFLDISEVEDRLAKGDIGYWLYDKTTKTWIVNMTSGGHELLTGCIYDILTDSDEWQEDAAEKYLTEHFGFFVSGSMNNYIPMKDENYILADDEYIFNRAKGRLHWRGIL